MKSEEQEPERLSHEWHARRCEVSADWIDNTRRPIPSDQDTRLAERGEAWRDNAAKLRQAERDAEELGRLRSAANELRDGLNGIQAGRIDGSYMQPYVEEFFSIAEAKEAPDA